MYTAIIIDDEANARSVLSMLLTENCPQLSIVAEAYDVPSGVKAIHQYQPDIVFSDIEMPNYDGFQLLDFVDKANFELIYCTGHNEFALKAFEVSAIAYLLKPIQLTPLINAVSKAIKLINAPFRNKDERLTVLKENIKNPVFKKIALPVIDGLIFIEVNEIAHLEAEGSYTTVYLKDNSKLTISKKLKEFENILVSNDQFFRTHRSHIVNSTFIKQYIKTDGGSIILQNNQTVPVARERKDDFLRLIEQIKI
ncbi:MAG: LytTR family DNA-binding domain-containing protein [Chitinophagales bacterium]|nr:LytTR family DNA-binding domain-containing protein [Chitinophagales bacterium]